MNIDFEKLLMPVAGDHPVGINIEHEPIFEEIRQARESDPDYLPQDEWSSALKKADWPKVIQLCSKVLSECSKDMQVACWLVEGCYQQYGLNGAVQGIQFLQAFTRRYWNDAWPAMADDGDAIRSAILCRLDRQLTLFLNTLPLLGQPESALEYWQKVQAYEHVILMKPGMADRQEEEDFSLETWHRWTDSVTPAGCAALHAQLQQLEEGLKTFEQQLAHVTDGSQGLALAGVAQITEDLVTFVRQLSARTAPAREDVMCKNVLAHSEETGYADYAAMTSSNDAVEHQKMSRDLAIAQMLTIAHFFRQTEPSSPVPFLMERAARWANMTLTEWLDEMLRDENALLHINNVLTGPA